VGIAMTIEDTRAAAGTVDPIYWAGASGAVCWARNHRGHIRELPMTRWIGGPNTAHHDRLADEQVLRYCSQRPTLDLGCGPGRFTAFLQQRGSAALGVDSSRAAVELTRERGGTAIHADLFAPLPAEGCWEQVLLTDGNIGIGGDPVRTLGRAADLLAPAALSSPRSIPRRLRSVTNCCAGKPNILSGNGFRGHASTLLCWATSLLRPDFWSPTSLKSRPV
jgi:SAM-dependent methyltransferase